MYDQPSGNFHLKFVVESCSDEELRSIMGSLPSDVCDVYLNGGSNEAEDCACLTSIDDYITRNLQCIHNTK